MDRLFKIAASVITGVLALTSCEKTPVAEPTETTPQIIINRCTESTYFGADIKFSIGIEHNDAPLSALKATLYYNEVEVNCIDAEANTDGIYEGVLHAPILKNINNGVASVVFSLQNVKKDTVYVELRRPNFQKLTLKAENRDYELSRVEESGYKYELTEDFPKEIKGHIATPAINPDGDVITFGWDGFELSGKHSGLITFSTGKAGNYTVSVDLMSLTVSPQVSELKQGQVMDFNDAVDVKKWILDPDFFATNNDFIGATFTANDGFYNLLYNREKMLLMVEPVDAQGAPLTLAADGTGAPWAIGKYIGKPLIGPSWDEINGAYPLAQVSDKVYQITLCAPEQIALANAEIKFFYQKGWGGEFRKADYAEINLDPAFEMTSAGNIKGKNIKENMNYIFTLDLTGGVTAAKVSYEEVENTANLLDVKVNGVTAQRISNDLYKVVAAEVTQNSVISFEGIDNIQNWYADPDHFERTDNGLKFRAVSGWYSFELNRVNQFITVRRVKADGTAATYADEGAITLMGWGVAHPVMTSQVGFENGLYLTLAEIGDGVYQFSGTAVDGSDGTTYGGVWRYSGISFKLFGQAGWGAEYGTVTLTDEAKKLLRKNVNVENIEGVTLEKGETYVMTVKNCTPLDSSDKFNCTIDFRKK